MQLDIQQSDLSEFPRQKNSQKAIYPKDVEAQYHNPLQPGFIAIPGMPPHNIFRSVIRNTQCRCCSLALWWNKVIDPQLKEERQLLVPLKHVKVVGILEAGHAVLDVQLNYVNVGVDSPIECTFEFPLEKNSVISKLLAQIDDRIIEAKVKAKEDAKEQYDDAIAAGNTAVYVERDKKKDESISLILGNLLPGQTAQIDLQIIRPLKIVGGAYEFSLPISFLPQYSKHQADQINQNSAELTPEYTFEYEFQVVSSKKITFLSGPLESQKVVTPRGYRIIMPTSNKIPKREIKVYFKTEDMLCPQLCFQIDKERDEVACMATLVPTFEPKHPQDAVLTNETPESAQLSKGEDFSFIFLVDRSGSMGGTRIEITKEALKLFIQSLPVGSKFGVLSFGGKSEWCKRKNGRTCWEYNDQTMKEIIGLIGEFQANFGGTNILEPLQLAIKENFNTPNKRIFLLTDGQVGNTDEIIAFAGKSNQIARIHTFGIGNGCDKRLVQETANAGRGSCSFASDSTANLSAQVIEALRRSFEPSLQGCGFFWPNRQINLREVFRDQQITTYEILSVAQFQSLNVHFHSDEDPVTKSAIDLNYSQSSFYESSLPLFQMAAHEKLQTLTGNENVKLSVKYQVLSKETAMIGIVKQKNKASGEMIEYTIQMGRKVSTAVEREDFKVQKQQLQPRMPAVLNYHQNVQQLGVMCRSSVAMPQKRMMMREAKAPSQQIQSNTFNQSSSQSTLKAMPICQAAGKQVILPTASRPQSAIQQHVLKKKAQPEKKQIKQVEQFEDYNCEEDDFEEEQSKKESKQSSLKSKKDCEAKPIMKSKTSLQVITTQNLQAPAQLKPTFKQVIALQSSEGFWNSDSRTILQQFLTKLIPMSTPDTTIFTLVALCILEECFADQEDEWQLIAQKARAYLKKLGVNIQQEQEKILDDLM